MNFSSFILFVITIGSVSLSSCVSVTNTHRNLEKIDAELPEIHPKENPTPIKSENPNENNQSKDSDKPIPLDIFLSPNQKAAVKYPNNWFPKLVEWSKVYRNIAIEEKNVRSFSLSEKYSKIALMWADRAVQIKNMSLDQSSKVVQPWLDYMKFPALPSPPRYFEGQDAFVKIVEIKSTLESYKQRMCLIEKGYQIIPAAAYLDIAVDLLQKKLYSKAVIMSQNGWSLISQVNDEKTACMNETHL